MNQITKEVHALLVADAMAVSYKGGYKIIPQNAKCEAALSHAYKRTNQPDAPWWFACTPLRIVRRELNCTIIDINGDCEDLFK